MSGNSARRLADELSYELTEYLKLKDTIVEVQSRFINETPNDLELNGIGKLLQDVYQGAERIFERIVKNIDKQLPQGEDWHRKLLVQVTEPVAGTRPAILQQNTAILLEEYLRFRHRFIKNYGLTLDWSQMKPLVNTAPPAINALVEDIKRFIAVLRMISA